MDRKTVLKERKNTFNSTFQAEMKAAEEQRQKEEEEEKRKVAEKRREEKKQEREVRFMFYRKT